MYGDQSGELWILELTGWCYYEIKHGAVFSPITLWSPCEGLNQNKKSSFKIVFAYSIKVASEKNDAWSMFHSPRFIIVAKLVNYVPAMSLET